MREDDQDDDADAEQDSLNFSQIAFINDEGEIEQAIIRKHAIENICNKL